MQLLKQYLKNMVGWKTKRRIIVIESDDWGTIRTRSKNDLNILRQHDIRVDDCHYMLNDSLASESDLTSLFEVLSKFKDANNTNPIITANCLTANPDFDKIRDSNFEDYFYEDIRKTFLKYPNHSKSFDLWNEARANQLFHFQSHGREHLNVSRWMRDLKNNLEETKTSFHLEMFGISGHITNANRGSYLAAFDGGATEITYNREAIVSEALSMFKKLFGYYSTSFIAPNYVWDNTIENVLSNNHVKYIQSSTAQYVSNDFGKKKNIKRHYLGQKNKHKQIYLVRNCFFEPSENQNSDWVNRCLSEIEVAFKFKNPAIISTHRVNYIGYINESNRDNGLKKLESLLKSILKKWPDVEFMTSDMLGKLIDKNGK